MCVPWRSKNFCCLKFWLDTTCKPSCQAQWSLSEHILQDHFHRHNTNAAALKDLIQRVIPHPDFNADDINLSTTTCTSAWWGQLRRAISKSLTRGRMVMDRRTTLWTRLCRHAAGPGRRQQALRGDHLNVALWQGPPPDGVYRWGGEDQGQAAQR
jgi:hypothetical protein